MIIKANFRDKLLDQENDEEVIMWLFEYEKLSGVVEYFYCLHFECFYDIIKVDKIIVSKEIGIKIELFDFKEFLNFEKEYLLLLLNTKKKITKLK